jgi:uncharacterized protein YdaU (DUF1376 family)
MGMPYLKLYIGDYLRDTAHLTATQSGAYLHLIMHYAATGALPTDDGSLSRIARMSPKAWASVKGTVKAFFEPDMSHKRIDKELLAYSLRAMANAKNGATGGRPKKEDNSLETLEETKPNGLNLGSPNKTFPEPEPEPEREEKKTNKEVTDRYAARFEYFWTLYPRKEARKAAASAFAKAMGREKSDERIFAGLERYKSILARSPDRPAMHAATFLNGDRFLDDPSIFAPQPRNSGKNGFSFITDRIEERAKNDAEQARFLQIELNRGNVPSLPGVCEPNEPGKSDRDLSSLCFEFDGLPQ